MLKYVWEGEETTFASKDAANILYARTILLNAVQFFGTGIIVLAIGFQLNVITGDLLPKGEVAVCDI